MDLPRYERIWLWFGSATLVFFLFVSGFMGIYLGLNPADGLAHTVEPERVDTTAPFDKPGLYPIGPNEYEARIVSFIFGYSPNEIRVPAGSTVHFKVVSKDVVHGLFIPGTNVNLMVSPGHVTEMTHRFDNPGEYLILCHEYCGSGHHLMQGRLIVESQERRTGDG